MGISLVPPHPPVWTENQCTGDVGNMMEYKSRGLFFNVALCILQVPGQCTHPSTRQTNAVWFLIRKDECRHRWSRQWKATVSEPWSALSLRRRSNLLDWLKDNYLFVVGESWREWLIYEHHCVRRSFQPGPSQPVTSTSTKDRQDGGCCRRVACNKMKAIISSASVTPQRCSAIVKYYLFSACSSDAVAWGKKH